MSTLVDGMHALDERGHLTMLTTWTVRFSTYAHRPFVAVPPDTSLDEVERLARQALLLELESSSRTADPDAYAAWVAKLSVESIKRRQSVTLHPSVG